MSTTMAKPETVERKWFVIDAAGKPLGRVAAKAASMLRGKHKVIFTPHVDCGDHIIIINCKDAVLTGKKLGQKVHYWHTGWIGGIKAMTLAVEGMLPHNSLGRKMAKRLRAYATEKHDHIAQKPEVCDF